MLAQAYILQWNAINATGEIFTKLEKICKLFGCLFHYEGSDNGINFGSIVIPKARGV